MSHPTWPDAPTLERSLENDQAAAMMNAFYLSRGFMEAPTWEEIGADARYGWIGLVRTLHALRGPDDPDPEKGAAFLSLIRAASGASLNWRRFRRGDPSADEWVDAMTEEIERQLAILNKGEPR